MHLAETAPGAKAAAEATHAMRAVILSMSSGVVSFEVGPIEYYPFPWPLACPPKNKHEDAE